VGALFRATMLFTMSTLASSSSVSMTATSPPDCLAVLNATVVLKSWSRADE
jgi:hypothetical protein